jgi:DNA-binding PadR family transcriptional regulator
MAPALQIHWFHILLALADKPLNGAAITQEVLDCTDGTLQLWPGMLYGALRKMTDAGLVVEVDTPEGFTTGGGTPRFYKITALGRRTCAAEAARFERIVNTAKDKRVLRQKA